MRLHTYLLVLLVLVALVAGGLQGSDGETARVAAGAPPQSIQHDTTSPNPVVVDHGQIQHVNWFSDWSVCIWGIGLPGGVFAFNSGLAIAAVRAFLYQRTLSQRYKALAASAYGRTVIDACWRFVRS